MQELNVDKEDIVIECAMGQNFLLEYGGFTPAQCVLGHNPRGHYEAGTKAVAAHEGAASSSPDLFENYIRLRLLAKVCVQQSIIEHRIALANSSRPMQVDVSKLVPGKTKVDLYRVPNKKDDTGWRVL